VKITFPNLLSLVVAGLALGHAGRAAAVDVGVSVEVSQPGVYGRVDIGRFPQPQVVTGQPVLIVRPGVARPAAAVAPVYMSVPPGHRQNWRKHCGRYNACGVPVLFVQDRWYDDHVARHGHGKDSGPGNGPGKGHGKAHGNGKGPHGD
jgi:hypothetical protein